MKSNVKIFVMAVFFCSDIIGCLCQVALPDVPEPALDEIQENVLNITDASPENAINLEEIESKMLSLKEVNDKIEQKIIGELNRFKISKPIVYDMGAKLEYLNLTEAEINEKFDSITAYMLFVSKMYNKYLNEPEVFDQLNYDQFHTDHLIDAANNSLSQDQMNSLNTMLDISIANAKKNQALIGESLKDSNLEKMAQEVEVKRMELESEMKELTELITELELKPRDEEAIEKIKTTNIMEIVKLSSEIHKILSELNNSNAFLSFIDAIKDLVDAQKDLLSSSILI